jgi:glucosamine--fructose-6-phosphate aminotransferase (isomerizing)
MADAYSSADFRHGPIATVEPGLPVLVIAPEGRALEDVLDLERELGTRGAELLVISNAADALALARTPLPIPAELPEWLSPVVAAVPGQALGLRLALAKDLDPDVPRGLRKVTRTL